MLPNDIILKKNLFKACLDGYSRRKSITSVYQSLDISHGISRRLSNEVCIIQTSCNPREQID